jgi:hypothetical protein
MITKTPQSNFYYVTYSISFVRLGRDNFKEDVAYCKFFDSDSFANCSSFLASLKHVKKLRITHIDYELEKCNWWDYDDNISNNIH